MKSLIFVLFLFYACQGHAQEASELNDGRNLTDSPTSRMARPLPGITLTTPWALHSKDTIQGRLYVKHSNGKRVVASGKGSMYLERYEATFMAPINDTLPPTPQMVRYNRIVRIQRNNGQNIDLKTWYRFVPDKIKAK